MQSDQRAEIWRTAVMDGGFRITDGLGIGFRLALSEGVEMQQDWERAGGSGA